MQGVHVPSLVGKPGSCMPCGPAKKKKETESAVKSARMAALDGVGFLMELGSRG